MNKENKNHDMDHLKKQFYRNHIDPDATQGKAFNEAGKAFLKIWFLYVLPAVIILYALYCYIGW